MAFQRRAVLEGRLERLQSAGLESHSPELDGGASPGHLTSHAPDRLPPDTDQPVGVATADRRTSRRKKHFWLKQLHMWHWVSAAISLIGMFVFAITGITLNHAATISAEPTIVSREATLPGSLTGLLAREPAADAPLPPQVAAELDGLVGIDTRAIPAEWSDGEVYVAIPGPGRDAWVSIDRQSGAIISERTDRGWISFFNDLHKGRNTGSAWFWFIDVFAVACVVFTFTGLLLLQLHSRQRPSTWPLVGAGAAIPLIIILFFMHS